MVTIRITTDSAAFGEGHRGREIARILREAARKLEVGIGPRYLMDYDGNPVGTYQDDETE